MAEEREESHQKSSKKVEKASTPFPKEQGDKTPGESTKQGYSMQCHACHRYGHIARYCRDKQKRGVEAPGRYKDGSRSHLVTSIEELSDQQLEQELSKWRLEQEQQLAGECLESNINVVKGQLDLLTGSRCLLRGSMCLPWLTLVPSQRLYPGPYCIRFYST